MTSWPYFLNYGAPRARAFGARGAPLSLEYHSIETKIRNFDPVKSSMKRRVHKLYLNPMKHCSLEFFI